MDRRLDLHEKLTAIQGLSGVYYQPPANVHLEYPCIVYSLDDRYVTFANNKKYVGMSRFSVTLITRNPDDPKRNDLENLTYSSFNRAYDADNLHHYVFTIYN